LANLALNKPVLEASVHNPEIVTNGDSQNYTGHSGFAYFDFPGTLTVDLQAEYNLKCVQFKLWDGLGGGRGVLHRRRYKFRLGVSTDNANWYEFYDEGDANAIGWQIFRFHQGIQGRFVRLYGLHNTTNHQIHIVELEAHNDIPDDPVGHIGGVTNIDQQVAEKSKSQPTSIAKSTRIDPEELARTIKTLEGSILDQAVVQDIKSRFDDLIVLDQNLEAIRREIVEPVTNEMKKSNRLAVWALRVTILAAILTSVFSPAAMTIWTFLSGLWS